MNLCDNLEYRHNSHTAEAKFTNTLRQLPWYYLGYVNYF